MAPQGISKAAGQRGCRQLPSPACGTTGFGLVYEPGDISLRSPPEASSMAVASWL